MRGSNGSCLVRVGIAGVLTLSLSPFASAQMNSPVVVEVVENFGCQNGNTVSWTVPTGATTVTVVMAGGEGGAGSGGRSGGRGGGILAGSEPKINVSAGEVYGIIVGCRGENGSSSGGSGGGGYGSGGSGAGSPGSGGGGGASAFLNAADEPLVVAGGGGGGTLHGGTVTGSFGGPGGGLEGGDGVNGGGSYQGGGGTQTMPGTGGNVDGLIGCPCSGNDGIGPHGGDGAGNGGGGGGGLFGGGGGGILASGGSADFGGGGGGSGHIAPGLSGTLVSGTRTGHGFVSLTYDAAIDPQVTVAIVFDMVAGGTTRLPRFDVENLGGAAGPGPELTISAPAESGVFFDDQHASFEIPADWSCELAPGGSSITCTSTTLDPGEGAAFFVPSAAHPWAPAGPVTITAHITAGGASGSATPQLEVIRESDVQTSFSGPNEAIAGEPFDVTVAIHNEGPSDSKGVTIVIDLPDHVDLVGWDASQGEVVPGSVNWLTAPIAVGADAHLTLTLRANEPGPTTVSGDFPDGEDVLEILVAEPEIRIPLLGPLGAAALVLLLLAVGMGRLRTSSRAG